MQIVFETERLVLRKFTKEDVELIHQLSDAEIIKYTGDSLVDLNGAEDILLNIILPQYQLYGHGRWAVHLKENMQYIGWCGLKYNIDSNETDLGYRYLETYWGKGFAYEAAKATIDFGLNSLKIKCITGKAHPENIASIRVLEKCGMKYIGQETTGHGEAVVFKIGAC